MAKSPKPSVDQQLSTARVVHGSRLEQLIRDNQDVNLLHPSESDEDRTGLPLWLRVHWRKNHPEASHSPDDPTGGYPRALKSLYSWMIAHQDLPGIDEPPDTAQGQGSSPAAKTRTKAPEGKEGSR